MKRVFIIVLDSLGIGYEPDAADFGDVGADTLRRISASEKFDVRNLIRLGIGHIDGIDYLEACAKPEAAVGRLREKSRGKDTTIGHWEIAGILSEKPLPTYPHGFPDEVIDAFVRETGYGVLCNKPYSGTDVIRVYGEEHCKTRKLIVYTSADSVFQIAAHEELVPPETLYEICRTARRILVGKHGVGRVIARPFIGEAGHFTRTTNRHDFSLAPPAYTMLNAVWDAGMDSIAVGKITDIFAGDGITESILTHGNAEGMRETAKLAARDFHGLCFVNLVDFDMLYGHRQDVDGYAAALTAFDRWLPSFLEKLGEDDCVILTADHGCDPGDDSTDHTREYVPFLCYGKKIKPVNIGTRPTFSDIARTVCDLLGTERAPDHGESLKPLLLG